MVEVAGNGWYKGTLGKAGQPLLVPGNYIVAIPEHEAAKLVFEPDGSQKRKKMPTTKPPPIPSHLGRRKLGEATDTAKTESPSIARHPPTFQKEGTTYTPGRSNNPAILTPDTREHQPLLQGGNQKSKSSCCTIV